MRDLESMYAMQWVVFFILITLMKGGSSWAMTRQIVLVSHTYLRSGVLCGSRPGKGPWLTGPFTKKSSPFIN
jgi:hypothetical protein